MSLFEDCDGFGMEVFGAGIELPEVGIELPEVGIELPVGRELPKVGICEPDEELVRDRVDEDFWVLLPDFGIRVPPFEDRVRV